MPPPCPPAARPAARRPRWRSSPRRLQHALSVALRLEPDGAAAGGGARGNRGRSGPDPDARSTSAAPEPPQAPAAPRSLADLVDLALSRDPATRAAWHDARAAAAQAGAQRSLYWPTIDASASTLRQRTGGGSRRATPPRARRAA